MKISFNKESLKKEFDLHNEFDQRFDNIANRYEQVTFGISNGSRFINKKEQELIISLLSNHLNSLRDRKILDVGAGNGRWSKLFMTLGCEVYSLDNSSEMCRVLREIHGLSVIQGDIQDIELEEKFDLVFSMRALKYTNLSRVLANIRNLMNDKGILVFDVPNRLNPFYFTFYYLSLILIHFFKYNKYLKYSLISHLYTRSAAEKIISSLHYRVIERKSVFFFPDFIYLKINSTVLLKLIASIDRCLSKILPRSLIFVVQKARE